MYIVYCKMKAAKIVFVRFFAVGEEGGTFVVPTPVLAILKLFGLHLGSSQRLATQNR